ncbi:hypothetical protein [Salinisphaera sp. Q1T1-3]|uniref:hypothetical protein n=1 Tax=Salinisphaera sp. Q1T1-3 TaxID=2321229 RepID=UPI0011C36699|nr:hypothetical protein [Salinisphaera sp. Q1T1-3]
MLFGKIMSYPRFVSVLSIAAAGCLAAGCATSRSADSSHAGAPDDATQAMFDYLFANSASSDSVATKATYCVGLGTRPDLADPSPALVNALASEARTTVVPASQCQAGTQATDAAGQPAMIFHVDPVSQSGGNAYEYRAGYYEGNLGGGTGHYRVEFSHGAWHVSPIGAPVMS